MKQTVTKIHNGAGDARSKHTLVVDTHSYTYTTATTALLVQSTQLLSQISALEFRVDYQNTSNI